MSYQASSMETTTTTLQSHSTDSFSYRWLPNLNPISTVDYPSHDHDETSFIEMDPRLPPSKRFFRVPSSDHFCFDFPVSGDDVIGTDHRTVAHVDCYTSATSYKRRVICGSLRKCRRFFGRYLKYLLRPFLCRRRCFQFDNRSSGVKWELSAATLSPRTSLAYSSADDNWRRSCDSESSIYEAVLHCKKTQV